VSVKTHPLIRRILTLCCIMPWLMACQKPPWSSPSDVAMSSTSPATGSATAGETAVVIRFACNEGTTLRGYAALAEEFHRQHPHIKIDLVPIESVLPAGTVSTEDYWHAIASSADTLAWSVSPEAVRMGLVRDLSSLIADDSTLDSDDFYSFMLDYYHWGDGQWALPGRAIPIVVFYNRDAFDHANLAYPESGWKLDEFLQLAQQLTVHDDGRPSQYGFAGSLSMAFLPSMNGHVLTDPTTVPDLNRPEVMEGLRWSADLLLVHGVMPDPAKINAMDQTHAAMWLDYAVNLEARRESSDADIGIAPFPLGSAKANLFEIEAYWMSSGTQHPDESWQWLKFLTHQAVVAPNNAFVPPRRSVTEKVAFWTQWQEEEAEALRFALAHPLGYPIGPTARALQQALAAMWKGEASSEAVSAAQTQAMKAYTEYLQLAPIAVDLAPATGSESAQNLIFNSQGFDTTYYRGLAEAFNAQQGTYHIELSSPNQGKTADCFSGPSSTTQGQAAVQPLNLQPFLEGEHRLELGDFAWISAFQRQGDLYGLPSHAAATVMFYNPERLQAGNVKAPQPGWTISEFLQAAQGLTYGEGDMKHYGFVPLDGDASVLQLFVAIQNAALWDASGHPRFNAPDVIDAVQWYANLGLDHEVMPVSPDDLPIPKPQGSSLRQTWVEQGRVGMWTDLVGMGQQPPSSGANMVPLPGDQAQVIPYGLFIAADSSHANGCWEWLVFAATQKGLPPELGIPAYTPVLSTSSFTSRTTPDVVATYRALLNYDNLSQPPGAGPQYQALLEALAEIYEGADPQTALEEAQRAASRP
jgi:multiple sugar transport system substrate-binding protein